MTAALIDYPRIADARLPASYEAAKIALAECDRIDECITWADKMAALASYGKQSEDETLQKAAMRIRARAIQRAGELIREFEAAKRGPKLDVRADTQLGRFASAERAGLSRKQTVTALRVANVPRDEFDRAVESDDPPTVMALAKRGKATRPAPVVDLQGRDPADFAAATQAIGTIGFFVEFIGEADIPRVLRGGLPHDIDRLNKHLRAIGDWAKQAGEACDVVFGK